MRLNNVLLDTHAGASASASAARSAARPGVGWATLRVSFVAVLGLLAVMLPVSQAQAQGGIGSCSQPVSTGTKPVATDCLFLLQAAVGAVECADCVCDSDGSGVKSASDALRCLKFSVGSPGVALACPACDPGTTTTTTTTTVKVPPSSSTSSSSTSSSTTTIPQRCTRDLDCELLPGFRCNPNNSFCEAPCFEDEDCNGFYDCDLQTNFCVEPL